MNGCETSVAGITQLTRSEFLQFIELLRRPPCEMHLPEMTLESYLGALEIAYGGIFSDTDWLETVGYHLPTLSRLVTLAAECGIDLESLPDCSSSQKYRALAQGCHGGLLDLPLCDPDAFRDWYANVSQFRNEPFDVVAGYGGPGIVLWPAQVAGKQEAWQYELFVLEPQYYPFAVRMALALDRAGVPFQFDGGEEVIGGLVLRKQHTAHELSA